MKKIGQTHLNNRDKSTADRPRVVVPKTRNKAVAPVLVAEVTATRAQAFRTEKAMQSNEGRIPLLAANAVKQARANTLQAGRSVVEVVDGKLVETLPDGSSKVIRSIAPPTSVAPEKRLIRKVK